MTLSNTKLVLTLLSLIFCLVHVRAQNGNEDHWEVYLASYDKGVGSTMVNFSLYDKSPIKKYPFVVVTGVTYTNCSDDGFPKATEFPKLYVVSDSIQACITRCTNNINAGSFTYQCQRLDYIYLVDTLLVRKKLEELYTKYFKQYDCYIHIKNDEKWEAYRSFLYPNEETMEYILNSKVVIKLNEAGDKLDKGRLVEHWAYFKSTTGRDSFITYVKSIGFNVLEKKTITGAFPYSLHMARTDKVTLDSIDKITLDLRRRAKKLNGYYDGWESVVVK